MKRCIKFWPAIFVVIFMEILGILAVTRYKTEQSSTQRFTVADQQLVYQQRDNWCVPASASISLDHMGLGMTQAQVAQYLPMVPAGVANVSQALVGLNSLAQTVGYTYVLRSDASVDLVMLRQVLDQDLNGLHQYTLLSVKAETLPWTRLSSHTFVGHEIVAVSYDSKSDQVQVWDPWQQENGGLHTLTAARLLQSLQMTVGVIGVERS